MQAYASPVRVPIVMYVKRTKSQVKRTSESPRPPAASRRQGYPAASLRLKNSGNVVLRSKLGQIHRITIIGFASPRQKIGGQ